MAHIYVSYGTLYTRRTCRILRSFFSCSCILPVRSPASFYLLLISPCRPVIPSGDRSQYNNSDQQPGQAYYYVLIKSNIFPNKIPSQMKQNKGPDIPDSHIHIHIGLTTSLKSRKILDSHIHIHIHIHKYYTKNI